MIDWMKMNVAFPLLLGFAITTCAGFFYKYGRNAGIQDMQRNVQWERDERMDLQNKLIKFGLAEWRCDPRFGQTRFCLKGEQWPNVTVSVAGECQ